MAVMVLSCHSLLLAGILHSLTAMENNYNPLIIVTVQKWEREIKFIGLFADRGHRGPNSPYKPCNHNLYIAIVK